MKNIKSSGIQWAIPLWLATGFAFLIVPQRLGRFDGANDPNLVTFYEVANNARYLTHTEAIVVKSLYLVFAITTVLLVLSVVRLNRIMKKVQPTAPADS